MILNFDARELEPIIATTVAKTLAAIQATEQQIGDRLAMDECEAAKLIGLERHQLRDERLRGRIAATVIVGKRVRYLRSDLLAYLSANRIEARA